jgi:hypothetical protein
MVWGDGVREHDSVNAGGFPEQTCELSGAFQKHGSTAFVKVLRESDELDHVAKPLLGCKKDTTTC